jgi:hypothetical protein
MRNMNLVAALALATAAGMGAAQAAMPAPRKGGSRDYTPNPPRVDSALAREIAEHNAAVERRRAEKMARRGRR